MEPIRWADIVAEATSADRQPTTVEADPRCSSWWCPSTEVVVDDGRLRFCAEHAELHRYTCTECSTPFYRGTERPFGEHGWYCTDDCRRARDRRRKARTPVAHDDRACDGCGQAFTPARSDARYCSGRCRVAAHRARTSA